MKSIETIIPDNEGNHLVVTLIFYEDVDKSVVFGIPDMFKSLDIGDISISKIALDRPLGIKALLDMGHWLLDQFQLFPEAVFTFICSIDELEIKRTEMRPELYRWKLFDVLTKRLLPQMKGLGISVQDITVGPEGFESFARVYYRQKHASVVHVVIANLKSKYD